jgi:hypothetical protein
VVFRYDPLDGAVIANEDPMLEGLRECQAAKRKGEGESAIEGRESSGKRMVVSGRNLKGPGLTLLFLMSCIGDKRVYGNSEASYSPLYNNNYVCIPVFRGLIGHF